MFLLIACHALQGLLPAWISIHLMFLLISEQFSLATIQCYNFNTSHVSINPSWQNNATKILRHFNTSHVSINPGRIISNPIGFLDFNTSHVSINPFVPLPSFMCFSNFNTSHVSINPLGECVCQRAERISIHLMFLLIAAVYLLCAPFAIFQYISCFY